MPVSEDMGVHSDATNLKFIALKVELGMLKRFIGGEHWVKDTFIQGEMVGFFLLGMKIFMNFYKSKNGLRTNEEATPDPTSTLGSFGGEGMLGP